MSVCVSFYKFPINKYNLVKRSTLLTHTANRKVGESVARKGSSLDRVVYPRCPGI